MGRGIGSTQINSPALRTMAFTPGLISARNAIRGIANNVNVIKWRREKKPCNLGGPAGIRGERTGMDGWRDGKITDFRSLQIPAGIPAALAAGSAELRASTAGQGCATAGDSAGCPCPELRGTASQPEHQPSPKELHSHCPSSFYRVKSYRTPQSHWNYIFFREKKKKKHEKLNFLRRSGVL